MGKNCKKCNQNSICKQDDCSCPVKDLSTDCILYTGANLTCSGIQTKTVLTDLIEQLDEFICTLVQQSMYATTLISIGLGEDIYAGTDLQGRKKIRTLNVQSLGESPSLEIVKPLILDSEEGIVIPSRTISVQNLSNSGTKIVEGLTLDSLDGIRIPVRNIDSESLTVKTSANTVFIETPSKTNEKVFYVDPFSNSTEETGSRAKPFKTLKKAIDAFIDAPNGGTVLSPIWGYNGKIELLNNVNVFSDLNNISVNQLNIEGNGYTLNYYGNQDYFISTKYLVDLDPKSVSGKLDYDIKMTFNNLTIATAYVVKMVYHLSYTSPTATGFQNVSGLIMTNCRFFDSTWQIGNSSAYINTGQIHFGVPVYAQNTLPGDAYMIRNENISWFGDSSLRMNDCKLYPTTSTALYHKNTSAGHTNLSIDYNYVRRNYSNLVGSVYENSDSVYYILIENDYPISNIGKPQSFLRVINLVSTTDPSDIGGQAAIIKVIGEGATIVEGGEFYVDFPTNIVQIENSLATVDLKRFNASSIYTRDNVYGAFKYVGTTPLTTQKYIWVEGSTINNVKQGTPLTDYILPSANFATINGAMFNTLPSYPDDASALSAGLINNCIYYNTTTSSLKKIL